MSQNHDNPEVGQMAVEGEPHPLLEASEIEAAMRLAHDPSYKPRDASRTQATSMASTAEIELLPEEILLYSALREQMPDNGAGGSETNENKRNKAFQLSDQEILAEVVRLSGDQERLKKFKKPFTPHIFREESA